MQLNGRFSRGLAGLLVALCFVAGVVLGTLALPSDAQASGDCTNCGSDARCTWSALMCDCSEGTGYCTAGCSQGRCPV